MVNLVNILNSSLCGFQEADSSQHALFKLLKAWKGELDLVLWE